MFKIQMGDIYLKTDNDKVINAKHIRWIEKMNECLSVCVKSDGCHPNSTHKICKMNNSSSYAFLNKYFMDDYF